MDRRRFTAACLLAASQSLIGRRAEAEEEMPDDDRPGTTSRTMGGMQFWGDEMFFQDWHIQRNALTGHCRLLDGANMRHAWGTFEQCRNHLNQIRNRNALPDMSGPAVVLLHGLFRSGSSMSRLGRYLHEDGQYTIFNVNYPTTRGSVGDHAAALGKIVDNLTGVSEINFVAHSLGNLVLRHYLADHTRENSGIKPDKRIRRIVMLGPPNNGSQVAQAFGDMKLFHFVVGASGSQLARDWEQLKPKLATPDCEFGILAGGRSGDRGFNPLLKEDNDMIVSVESTRLAGAADFKVVPVLHSFLMEDPIVQKYTLRFLQKGYFVSEQQRQRITAEDVQDAVPTESQS